MEVPPPVQMKSIDQSSTISAAQSRRKNGYNSTRYRRRITAMHAVDLSLISKVDLAAQGNVLINHSSMVPIRSSPTSVAISRGGGGSLFFFFANRLPLLALFFFS
jgi:hypothetical protein